MKNKLVLDEQYSQYEFLAGCDEAGRGCLLGPVVASSVILPKDFYSPLINDSKKLSEKQREEAFKIIQENAVAIGIGIIAPETIDEINILESSKLAMEEALKNMNHQYDFVLCDAVTLKHIDVPQEGIMHGDAKSLSIAAASIIAKVTRDHICYELDKIYPQYNIKNNKGYGTKDHLEALRKFGPVKGLHRFSYRPVYEANNVNLFDYDEKGEK